MKTGGSHTPMWWIKISRDILAVEVLHEEQRKIVMDWYTLKFKTSVCQR